MATDLMATDLDIVSICEASQAHTEKPKIDQILGPNRFWCSKQQTAQQTKAQLRHAGSPDSSAAVPSSALLRFFVSSAIVSLCESVWWMVGS